MSGLDIERLRIELIPEEEPSPKVLNRWCEQLNGKSQTWYLVEMLHNSWACNLDSQCKGIVRKKFSQGDIKGGISYCYTCKKEVFVDVNSLQVGLKLHPNWC